MSKKEAYWWLIKEIFSEIFKISLITYLIFYLIDNFKSGFVSDYLNLNIILIITLVSGVFTVLFKKEDKEKKPQNIKKRDYIFIIFLGIITSGLIYYKIKELGWYSYIISIVSGIIIILLSILLLKDNEGFLTNNESDDQGSEN